MCNDWFVVIAVVYCSFYNLRWVETANKMRSLDSFDIWILDRGVTGQQSSTDRHRMIHDALVNRLKQSEEMDKWRLWHTIAILWHTVAI